MKSRNWLFQVDTLTKTFNDEFSDLSFDQLNWKPTENVWSVGQVIAHIIVTNESYYPTFQALNKGVFKAPFTANFGFISNLFGKMILKSVSPETKRKVNTFPIWEPAKSNISSEILEQFSIHHSKLKEFINDLRDSTPPETVISSPANKFIIYKLDTAFEIIIAHEKRHLEQAKTLCKRIDFGKN